MSRKRPRQGHADADDRDADFDLTNGTIKDDGENDDQEREEDAKDENEKEREGDAQGTFLDLKLQRRLLRQLHTVFGYELPTPIQREAIPLILGGADVWAVSATGTGKTAAFLLPILQRYLSFSTSGTAEKDRGVKSRPTLILLPTRELAVQCHQTALKYLADRDSNDAVDGRPSPPTVDARSRAGPSSGLTVLLMSGGLPKGPQAEALRGARHRVHVIIGTPGRVLDLCATDCSSVLRRCQTLILDEADRLLQEGFAEQLALLKSLLNLDPKSVSSETISFSPKTTFDRRLQVLLFSATLSEAVGDLARQLLPPGRAFRQVLVDRADGLSATLRQVFYRLRQTDGVTRWAYLLAILQELLLPESQSQSQSHFQLQSQPPAKKILVFVNRRQEAGVVGALLQRHVAASANVDVHTLHGDMNQRERLESLRAFAAARDCPSILVATDVASRGLDLPSIFHSSSPSDNGSYSSNSSTSGTRNKIDVVINLCLPTTYATYQHRVGRTARAGLPGLAISLVGPAERRLLREAHRHAPFEHRHVDYQRLLACRQQLSRHPLIDNEEITGKIDGEIDQEAMESAHGPENPPTRCENESERSTEEGENPNTSNEEEEGDGISMIETEGHFSGLE
jgi:ATP-dependent RNA helicase DDX27